MDKLHSAFVCVDHDGPEPASVGLCQDRITALQVLAELVTVIVKRSNNDHQLVAENRCHNVSSHKYNDDQLGSSAQLSW